MAGASLGGLLVQAFSGPAAIVVDALSYLGSALFLGHIHPPQPLATPKESESDLGHGLRLIWSDVLLRSSPVASAAHDPVGGGHRRNVERTDPGVLPHT
jgi:hypothetical protein